MSNQIRNRTFDQMKKFLQEEFCFIIRQKDLSVPDFYKDACGPERKLNKH